MRRIVLTLLLVATSLAPILAQQSQTTPPTPPAPPPAPRVATPAAPAPPTPPTPPAPQVARPAAVPRGTAGQAPSAPAATTPRPDAPSSWQNLKLEVTISDTLSATLQSRKTVSMMVLDGRSGQIRSMAGVGMINIDARPNVRPDGRIVVQMSIDYRPGWSAKELQDAGLRGESSFSESLALIVSDGKPIVASQAADPLSDRKFVVEVTASIVK